MAAQWVGVARALHPVPFSVPNPGAASLGSSCTLAGPKQVQPLPPALLLKGLGLAGSRQRGCPSLSSWVLGLLAVP